MQIRIKKVEKDRFKIYLEKAEQFFKLMKYAQTEGLWIGMGLCGVHCAISCCDALTTFYLGERSISQKHEDVVVLLRGIQLEGISDRIKQILSVLSVKSLVEYEAREIRRDDAAKIAAQVERFYGWVKECLR